MSWFPMFNLARRQHLVSNHLVPSRNTLPPSTVGSDAASLVGRISSASSFSSGRHQAGSSFSSSSHGAFPPTGRRRDYSHSKSLSSPACDAIHRGRATNAQNTACLTSRGQSSIPLSEHDLVSARDAHVSKHGTGRQGSTLSRRVRSKLRRDTCSSK